MKVTELLKRPFKTPFDDMSFHVDVASKGGHVRDKLLEFENRFGEVIELSSIAAYQAEIAKMRWETAIDLALLEVSTETTGPKVTIAMKKAQARNTEVMIPGDKEKTTPYKEEQRYYTYSYIAQRGKDKVKELNNVLDLGRSVLSWDRQELERLER